MIRKCSYTAVVLLLAWLMVSCQPHDPFCFNHPHGAVRVEYDWSQAPDATDIKGTRVYFYKSEDGCRAEMASFPGMKGGTIYLGEGVYDIISYNDYADRLQWRGDDALHTLEAYTRDAELTEDLPGFNYDRINGLVLTPNRIWSGFRERISVSRNDTTVVTLTPLKATYEVVWEVTGIRGAERVKACAVSISGVGGSLLLDRWQPGRNGSLMSGVGRFMKTGSKANSGEDTGGFCGEFEVFGCGFSEDCHHTFTIYCWSKGGNKKASYDVTGQFHTVKEDRKIYIRINADFEMPTGGGSDSGFRPDLDQWQDENEDIIL